MKKLIRFLFLFSFVLFVAAPCLKAQAAALPQVSASNHAITEQVGTFDAGKYTERLAFMTSPAKPSAAVTISVPSQGTAANINTALRLSDAGFVLSRGSDQVPADGILSETCTYDTAGNVVKRSVSAVDSSYNQEIRYTYGKNNEIDCQYIAIKANGSNIYYKYDAAGHITSYSHLYAKSSHITSFAYVGNFLQSVSALNGARIVTFAADAAGRITGYQAVYADLGCSETAVYTYNDAGCLLTGVVTRTGAGASTTYMTTYIY